MKTFGHSPNARLVVTRGALVELADQIEQQLTAGLGEGEIAEFIEHDEVFSDEIFRDPSLPSAARFGLEPVDEIDSVVKRPRLPARMQWRAMAIAK